MEPKSIDDYKQLVLQLKEANRKLERRNIDLAKKILEKTTSNNKEERIKAIETSILYTKKTIKIQAVARGYIQRKKFKKFKEDLASSSVRSAFQLSTNESVFQEMYKGVKTLGNLSFTS
jgi:hypothetical protein